MTAAVSNYRYFYCFWDVWLSNSSRLFRRLFLILHFFQVLWVSRWKYIFNTLDVMISGKVKTLILKIVIPSFTTNTTIINIAIIISLSKNFPISLVKVTESEPIWIYIKSLTDQDETPKNLLYNLWFSNRIFVTILDWNDKRERISYYILFLIIFMANSRQSKHLSSVELAVTSAIVPFLPPFPRVQAVNTVGIYHN